MTSPRSQVSDTDEGDAGAVPDDETPELNVYEINADRTVVTEPGNTDGWIATDTAVTPPE